MNDRYDEEKLNNLVNENKKLTRELRITKRTLEQITRVADAKDSLGIALRVANTKQKDQTKILLENCSSIIILLDEDGSIIMSTNELLRVTDTPNFDFIRNRNYEDIFSKHIEPNILDGLKRLINEVRLTGIGKAFEAWLNLPKKNTSRYYRIELKSVANESDNDSDVKNGILIVMNDQTDIMIEKQRAETANHAKSDFLATVSHEIRTPMNAIIGMGSALARLNLPDEYEKYIENINKSSKSLLIIINDLLDFSKIEAGKMDIIVSNFYLKNLIESQISIFSVICKEKNISIELNIDKNLPDKVAGDENKLEQIFTNLLSNACKYTNKGAIYFSAAFEKGNLIFKIKDSGIGIKEEDIIKLYKPFEQLDARKNKNVAGTGLGLAITSRLCRLLGGEILVDSIYGKGSEFTVIIPYTPATDDKSTTDKTLSSFKAPDAQVLVVDDTETNLLVAEIMLEPFGIVPHMVISGKKAVKLASMIKFDLIFMDHMMPEMDGVETTKAIKALGGNNEKVPIIALTANVVQGTEELLISSGMVDVLSKPMNTNSTNECLRKWLPSHLIVNIVE